MKSDSELRQTFNFKTEDDGSLVLITFTDIVEPEETTRLAQLVQHDIFDILKKDTSKAYRALVDITALKGASYLSDEAKKIYSDFAHLQQLVKMAVVGENLPLQIFVSLFMLSSGKDMIFKWFEDREKALDWLRE